MPDDVKGVAVPVLAHRMILETKARYEGADASDVVREIVETTPVPA